MSKKKKTILIEDFEEYTPGKFPDAWKKVFDKIPHPEIFIQEKAGRNNSKAVVLFNKFPSSMPRHYMIASRPLDGFESATYELSLWVKGQISSAEGCIGIVGDLWGNNIYAYATWTPSTEWQEVKLRFGGPVGIPVYCILRTQAGSQSGTLYVDDIRIEKK